MSILAANYGVLTSYLQCVQIKLASMNLAQMYMKRVATELESIRNSDRECSQESLLLQGVHFAYRAHQVILKSAVSMIILQTAAFFS